MEIRPGLMFWLQTMIAGLILFYPCSAVAQDSARIYISTDTGHTWTPSSAGFPAAATVNDFAVFDDTVYAGTEAHGMFVSHDGGRTWTPANEGLSPHEKITAVEVAQDVVFAGTTRNGIFVSKDAGKTWSHASAGLTNTNVRALAANARTVFSGTNDGVFASHNDGRSWSQLTKGTQVNGISVLGPKIFVAGTNGVVRSDDNGQTWHVIGVFGPVHNISTDGESVFAMSYNSEVLRTSDGGATWKKSDAGLPAMYTFQILELDDILLAGQWPGLYMSKNSGALWTLVRNGLPPDFPIKELVRTGKEKALAGAGQIR
jgi:photosystem II stability/assembly factor-like uncharacterized protein